MVEEDFEKPLHSEGSTASSTYTNSPIEVFQSVTLGPAGSSVDSVKRQQAATLKGDKVSLVHDVASGKDGLWPNNYSCDYESFSAPAFDIKADCHSGLSMEYTPVHYEPSLRTIPIYKRKSSHLIGGLQSQMNLEAWRHELQYENDADLKGYLDHGVEMGFFIVNPYDDIPSYCCDNYTSVISGDAREFVQRQIQEELEQNKYLKVDIQPHCVHALGAIPKNDGSYRIITDCKRPLGSSINNYMSETFATFSYKRIDDVVALLSPGAFMATVDIASAYRSISVHPEQWRYQGVAWPSFSQLEFMLDTRICFGLRSAPYLYTHISNFIVRCMNRRGFVRIINYLDDFIVIGDSFQECQLAQTELITLLGSLGFWVNWKKCSSPSTMTRYLGIMFDSTNMQLSLPEDKVLKLNTELDFFKDKKRATKRQIQRLCGILSHCAKVVKGARTFSRRIVDLLKGLKDGNPRIKLSNEFRADLHWWKEFSTMFNGVACCIEYNYGDGPCIFTDACLAGYGLVNGSDWQAGIFKSIDKVAGLESLNPDHNHWVDHLCDSGNINVLEMIPVILAVHRYEDSLKDVHLVVYTDNNQVLSNINTGISRNDTTMEMLRHLFWLCVKYNIHITARRISSVDNVVADRLSRVCASDLSSVINDFYLCCS